MERFSGKDWIKIDIANAYGKDKLTWKERLEWFENNKNNLSNFEPDEPARAYAGIKALDQVERNEPIGFMVALDATSSFAQMQGLLLGERMACYLSNVIGSEKRQDLYTYLYKKLTDKIVNCPKNITRAAIKQVIMQFFYGGEKTPKSILGEDIFNKFLEVMKEELPLCFGLRQYLIKHWNPMTDTYKWVLPDNFHVALEVEKKFTKNFIFKGKLFNFSYKEKSPTPTGKSLGPNFIHSVDGFILREMVARCMFNQKKIDALRKAQYSKPKVLNLSGKTLKDYKTINTLLELGKASGYYSIRLLDFITPDNRVLVPENILNEMLDSLPRKSFELGTIHDCYLCHPNYMNDVKEQYRHCLINLSKSNLLEFIFKQIFSDSFTYTKPEDLTELVKKEEYAIC